jgi:hypothetical protein
MFQPIVRAGASRLLIAAIVFLSVPVTSLEAAAMPKATLMSLVRKDGLILIEAKVGKTEGRGMYGDHLLNITSSVIDLNVFHDEEADSLTMFLGRPNSRIWGSVEGGIGMRGGVPRFFAHDKQFLKVGLVIEERGDWRMISWRRVRNPNAVPNTDDSEWLWKPY